MAEEAPPPEAWWGWWGEGAWAAAREDVREEGRLLREEQEEGWLGASKADV
jgi:hypothetical protein